MGEEFAMGLDEFITPSVAGSARLTPAILEGVLRDLYATIPVQRPNTILVSLDTWRMLKRVRHEYVRFHGPHRIGKRVFRFKRTRNGQKVVLA